MFAYLCVGTCKQFISEVSLFKCEKYPTDKWQFVATVFRLKMTIRLEKKPCHPSGVGSCSLELFAFWLCLIVHRLRCAANLVNQNWVRPSCLKSWQMLLSLISFSSLTFYDWCRLSFFLCSDYLIVTFAMLLHLQLALNCSILSEMLVRWEWNSA